MGQKSYPKTPRQDNVGKIYMQKETINDQVRKVFVWENLAGKGGHHQWLGFKSSHFANKILHIVAHIKFEERIPPASSNFGLKVCGKVHNDFLKRCQPDSWCLIKEDVACKKGGDSYVILIFNTVVRKGQKVKIYGMKVHKGKWVIRRNVL